jgi:outer membrane protein assembly factor BamB
MTTTAAPTAGSCHGIEVENPALVALSPADDSACWSALSNANAYAMAVADGRLLALTGPCPYDEAAQALVALDTATGNELWRHGLLASGTGPERGEATLGTGLGVVVPPARGIVEALDLASGQVLWTRQGVTALADGPDFVLVSPAVEAPTTIAALDRRSGQERWTAATPPGFSGGITADGKVVLVGGESSATVFDAATGQQAGELPIAAASDTPTVRLVDGVATGVTGTGASPNATHAYDVATTQELWTSPGYPPQRPEPTDGNVYVVVDAGVAALDPHTGAIRWTVEGSNLEAGPGLAITSPQTGAPDAPLEAVDPVTGQVRWTKMLSELDLPSLDTVSPAGFTLAYQNVLPSSSGIFFAYGNCIGS